MPTFERVKFRLLGRFAAELDGPLPRALPISSRKGRALLAYLVLRAEHQATRIELADLLWGHSYDTQARHSLRQCLVFLRRDLQPIGAELIQVDGETVRLDPARFGADAIEFAALAESAEPADVDRAAEMYRKELLADLSLDVAPFDEWLRAERQRFDSLAARAFAASAEQADAVGNSDLALARAERLLDLDPLAESSHRLLLRLAARHLGRDAAMARAGQLAELLRSELGVEPEAETRALVQQIRRGDLAPAPRIDRDRAVVSATPSDGIDVDPAQVRQEQRVGFSSSLLEPEAAAPAPMRQSRPQRVISKPNVAALAAVVVLVFASLGVIARDWLRPVEPERAAASDASWRSPQIYPGAAADPAALAERGVFAVMVLPFSADGDPAGPEQKLADRIANDLINHLSRAPAIRVISRQTSRLYRGRETDVAAIGAELGVRYLVDGNLRMEGTKARIDVSLIEAASRLQVWTDRFESERADRFAIQDEIVRALSRRLQINVISAEGDRQASKVDIDAATEALLARGWAIIFRSNVTGALDGADELFTEALRRGPENVSAMIGLAAFHISRVANLKVPTREPWLSQAEALLTRALARNADASSAHFFFGVLHRVRGNLDAALASLQKALDLNPSLAPAYAQVGHVLTRLGRPNEAMEHIQYAMRLSPKDPAIGVWMSFAGVAQIGQGNETAAIEWLNRALTVSPRSPLVHAALAAAFALKGDRDESRRRVQELRRLVPSVELDALMVWFVGPGGEAAHGSRFLQGLRIAFDVST